MARLILHDINADCSSWMFFEEGSNEMRTIRHLLGKQLRKECYMRNQNLNLKNYVEEEEEIFK